MPRGAEPERAPPWRGPRWALALLLAGLSMLGPFAIDTYLPAFDGIAASLGATPVQMQQTLSAYLFGFAAMNLFHGALADSFGRRPVVLAGIAVFTLASVVAPLIGGILYDTLHWHAIFWLLVWLGALLWTVVWRWLPETLPAAQAQRFRPAPLLRGDAQMVASPRFLALVVASGIPFNGMFLYVLSAPAFLGGHLQLAPTQFFWFFLCTVAGVMAPLVMHSALALSVASLALGLAGLLGWTWVKRRLPAPG